MRRMFAFEVFASSVSMAMIPVVWLLLKSALTISWSLNTPKKVDTVVIVYRSWLKASRACIEAT